MAEIPAIPTDRRALLAGIGGLAAGTFLTAGRAEAGPLNPPAAPASTPGPEPRIAINAQNTPGDADNTFIITESGSYYLEGNLNGELDKNGILIAANSVTIDLMGFTLGGLDRAGPASNRGITTDDARNNIIIRNGIVIGWGSDGINLSPTFAGNDSIIEHVVAENNAGIGIRSGFRAVVRACIARVNQSHGLIVPGATALTDCVAANNGGSGIVTGTACTVLNCSSQNNTSRGFSIGNHCTVTNCTTSNNGGDGINTLGGAMVSNCAASFNSMNGISCGSHSHVTGCNATFNPQSGIEVSFGCLVTGNNCSDNGKGSGGTAGAGIKSTNVWNRIEGNNCASNGRGIELTASGSIVTRNTCRSNITNWVIASNNRVGTIISSPASGSISGNTGGAGLGSTDPWANFTY